MYDSGFAYALVLAVSALGVEAQVPQAQGSKELAAQIAASVSSQGKTRIAVLAFRELDGRPTVLGTFLAEEMTTQLFGQKGLEIVERTMLDKVMGELKLGTSGAIDPESAKQLGKVAGVEAIVTGTITEMETTIGVNCRLIDVQTGKVFAAAQARILKDADIARLLGTSVGSAQAATPVSRTSPSSTKAKSQFVEGDIGVEQRVGVYSISIDNAKVADTLKGFDDLPLPPGAAVTERFVYLVIRLVAVPRFAQPRTVLGSTATFLITEVSTGHRFDPLGRGSAWLTLAGDVVVVFALPPDITRDLVLRVNVRNEREYDVPRADFKLRLR